MLTYFLLQFYKLQNQIYVNKISFSLYLEGTKFLLDYCSRRNSSALEFNKANSMYIESNWSRRIFLSEMPSHLIDGKTWRKEKRRIRNQIVCVLSGIVWILFSIW